VQAHRLGKADSGAREGALKVGHYYPIRETFLQGIHVDPDLQGTPKKREQKI